MSDSYKGKDGLRRDIAKLKHTGKIWFVEMKPHFARLFTKEMLTRPLHVFTNLWVEGCRAEPYFAGHVLMIEHSILTVLFILWLL